MMDDSVEDIIDEVLELLEGEVLLEFFLPVLYFEVDLGYIVFDMVFDEEIRAEDLAESVELECLCAYLD